MNELELQYKQGYRDALSDILKNRDLDMEQIKYMEAEAQREVLRVMAKGHRFMR